MSEKSSYLMMPRRTGKSTLAAQHAARVAQARADFRARHHCTHCGASLNNFHPYDDYMLTKAAWQRLHPHSPEGFICYTCLHTHAAHALTRNDLLPCLAYVNRTIFGLTSEQQARLNSIPEFHTIAIKQAAFIREHGLPPLFPVFSHLGTR